MTETNSITGWLRWLGAVAVTLFSTNAAAQELKLGAPFGDGMVIQRHQPISIWGEAQAGVRVEVELGGQRTHAIADSQGSWTAELPGAPAGEGLALRVVAGRESLVAQDIAFGDVFLCSGQSNMEFTMGESALPSRERRLPIDARLRLLKVPLATARVPQARFATLANWRSGQDATAAFSAVCLLFGREIAREQGVVVGLVNASYGGTPIESWMDRLAIVRAGGMEKHVQMLDAFAHDQAAAEARYGDELDGYWTIRESPWRGRMGFANLHNAMIAPLGAMRFAGVLWYQGENNANGSDTRADYRAKLDGLMAGWRARFGEETPFLVIQLAGFGRLADRAETNSWAEIREAQRLAAQGDPRAALVVTIDVGERLDIHPPLKKPVAMRAVQAARVLVYGQAGRQSGPAIRSAHFDESEVIARFADVEEGLFAASWGRPGPFQLCAGDRLEECRYADAQIVGDVIAVSVPEGYTPQVLRYCWAAAPICNVFDGSQQPLGPFEIAIERPQAW